MKTEIGIRELSVALWLVAVAWPARATSFSGELVDTRGGEVRTATFNVQDQSYRFETIEGAQTLIVTGDNHSGIVRLLVPAEKLYVEAGPDEPMSRMVSPFSFFAYYARTHAVRAEGSEKIDGVPCTKQVAFADEQVFATAWISEDYGFPLKVEVPILGRTVELRHLKRGPQDPALFALPADYKPAPARAEEPPPEWASQVPGAPVLAPPFQAALPPGKVIRIVPQAGRQLQLKGTNSTQENCAFTAMGFKNGRPLSDPSMNTVNVSPTDEVTMTFSDTPAEADCIVVHVRSGTATIKAAWIAAPGEAPSGNAAAGMPVSTAAVQAAEPAVQVDAPATADMASRIEVTWTGPGNPEDYIAVARPDHPAGRHVSLTRVREGNPLKIWAPSEPGQYEVRYVLARGGKLLAKSPITINAVTTSVETAGPVKVAGWISVTWVGPAAEGDYLSVARRDQAPGSFLDRTAAKQGNPVRVRAPSEPGDYEVRYILARGVRLLANAPVTVEDVTATIEAPAVATVGTDVEVRWTGPAYQEDLIVIARPGQAAGANVGSKPTRVGNPVKLRAPREPGDYELRYILGRGKRLLAKTSITITPAPGP